MKPKFSNIQQLTIAFQDEAVCREYLANMRWVGGKPVCPYCTTDKVWNIEGGKRFKCATCKKKFSVTVGTIMEDSNIPLSKWFIAIWYCTSHKKGVSSLQLHRDLGITQKSAWHMIHRIREMVRKKNPTILTGTIQADETFVGGKNKNRHADKKVKESQGRSFKDKTPIFGLLSEGKVNMSVVPDTKAKTLKPIIAALVEKGAIVVTDEWGAYNNLSNYQHEVVRHNDNEFVNKNGHHTNSLEGYWGLFKRGIFGIYHYASRKHLGRYCDEFSFRYNTRNLGEAERFDISLTKCETTLPYKQLIAK
jgi:transposase-like protein